jgi:NAD(P)-dependent dehydrogenase (short-subunit alcohol dehydrogenase family)
MTRHTGKVVLCAGSATGIGAATALRLGREGAKVVIGDVNQAGAQAIIDQIVAEGGEGLALEFDIAEPESVQALIAQTVSHFGGLDLMHVNATDRRLNRQDFDAVSTELEVFDRVHTVSLRGHLLCTRYGIPEILKRGGGAIVYSSSDASKAPANVRMSYGVAKAGLNALMRHVAFRWGKEGIRANAITPGSIVTDAMIGNTSEAERTEMARRVPSPRLGKPDDIAALVAFLLSDEAEWINGQAISINGGSIMAVG